MALALPLAACAAQSQSSAAATQARSAAAATQANALQLEEADALVRSRRVIEVQMLVLSDAIARGSKHAEALEVRREALAKEARRISEAAARDYAAFVDDPAQRASSERRRALAELARLYEDSGRIDEALSRLRELSAEAEGREAVLAHLSLAKLLFAREELDEALVHCEAAAKGGAPGERIEALYLKSWILRGLGEAKRPGAMREAMEALREVVKLGREGRSDVVESAEGELLELYATHGEPSEAKAFFAGAGEAKERLLSRLRERYERPLAAEPEGPISL